MTVDSRSWTQYPSGHITAAGPIALTRKGTFIIPLIGARTTNTAESSRRALIDPTDGKVFLRLQSVQDSRWFQTLQRTQANLRTGSTMEEADNL